MNFHQETLPNGLTILAECNPHALSTGLGFFVKTGSRDETPENAGVSHFLEHMAFKGNERVSGEFINRRFDEMGAKYNAYTTEEHTVYHAVVLPEFVDETTGLLSELLRPSLNPEEFASEQKVIIEEIGMYADLPSFTAYEYAMTQHFNGHPLGNSVLGTVQTVGGLTPERMRAYWQAYYGPESVVVAAAGNVDWPAFRDRVALQCSSWVKTNRPPRRMPGYAPGCDRIIPVERYTQECALMMCPAPTVSHPLRAAADILAVIMGDETGSRFYWSLVEPGKVESVEFGYHEYYGDGLYMMSVGSTPDAFGEAMRIIRQIYQDVMKTGVSDDELQRAKNKAAARLVLSAEKPRNRLGPLGYNWCYRETYRNVATELDEIRSINSRHIRALLDEFPLLPATTVCVGPLNKVQELDLAA
jgi:predicted Zn-dependent peptidase